MTTVGNILSTVGNMLSTVADTQYRGGIMMQVEGCHEYRGDKIFCYLSTPTVLVIFTYMYHDSPHELKLQKMISFHGIEHSHGTHNILPQYSL